MVSETVFVARNSKRDVYHEDEDCQRLETATTDSRNRDELEGWSPCSWCSDELVERRNGRGDWSAQQALAAADPGDLP